MASQRLDLVLVERGLVASRAAARRAIIDGAVTVDGAKADRPARRISDSVAIEVGGGAHRVSRAGSKLSHALDHFAIVVGGRRVLDAGASTGGFTEELLARGAAMVVAADVGHGQLHERLRDDPRVENHEGVNVRHLREGDLGDRFDLLTADLSFISLTKVVDGLTSQLVERADVVLLVKPQFEVGPQLVASGGIVRSATARRDALTRVAGAWAEAGWRVRGATSSPIQGGDGNIEYLVWLRRAPGMNAAVRFEVLTREEIS